MAIFITNERLFFSLTMSAIFLGSVVLIHEGGHLLAARLAGVVVERATIGFGPVLLAHQFGDTVYSLRLLPLGGSITMRGEETDDEALETPAEPGEYRAVSLSRRLAIILAGPLSNIGAAYAILLGLALVYGQAWPFITAAGGLGRLAFHLPELFTSGLGPLAGLRTLILTDGLLDLSNGFQLWLALLVVVHFSIGLLNLLPLPPLDGGQAGLALVERYCQTKRARVLTRRFALTSGTFVVVGLVILNGLDLIGFLSRIVSGT